MSVCAHSLILITIVIVILVLLRFAAIAVYLGSLLLILEVFNVIAFVAVL